MAEIHVQIFDLRRPHAVEHPFEAAARYVTDLGLVRAWVRDGIDENVVPDLAIGKAAGAVNQQLPERISDAAAHCPEPVDALLVLEGICADEDGSHIGRYG